MNLFFFMMFAGLSVMAMLFGGLVTMTVCLIKMLYFFFKCICEVELKAVNLLLNEDGESSDE